VEKASREGDRRNQYGPVRRDSFPGGDKGESSELRLSCAPINDPIRPSASPILLLCFPPPPPVPLVSGQSRKSEEPARKQLRLLCQKWGKKDKR